MNSLLWMNGNSTFAFRGVSKNVSEIEFRQEHSNMCHVGNWNEASNGEKGITQQKLETQTTMKLIKYLIWIEIISKQ